jgi:hypothetical protein
MRKWYAGLTCSLALALSGEATAASSEVPVAPTASGSGDDQILVPYLEEAPMIDGDLADWKERAFTDGVWDIHRVRYSSWFDPGINRLTDHGDEPVPEDDLQARYYIAWDERHLYLGVEARDNVNDVHDPEHADSRWYFKDAVAWFIEAPQDEKSEWFAQGDNSFGFVIDASKPSYGAWWRHGTRASRTTPNEVRRSTPAWRAIFAPERGNTFAKTGICRKRPTRRGVWWRRQSRRLAPSTAVSSISTAPFGRCCVSFLLWWRYRVILRHKTGSTMLIGPLGLFIQTITRMKKPPRK